jgi:hypothetical protein
MDNDDAENYNEQIKQFEDNSDITKLLKQQLFVAKSSLGSINNMLTDIEYNEEKVKTIATIEELFGIGYFRKPRTN